MKKLTMTSALFAAASAFAMADKDPNLAARVAADFPKMPESGICCYSVPATGERQYLPDVYPEDGVPGAPISIIAARDEYEPGSFVLYATKDLGKVQFEVSDLKLVEAKAKGEGEQRSKSSIFPKANLDLKVVKVWYQNGNGWFSYFQDTKLKLCPELLLNDEELVRVDEATTNNYARLIEKDGTKGEFWITAPRPVSGARTPEIYQGYHRSNDPFMCMKENFHDAPTFQGATLEKGRCKQFFLTAHVGKDVKPGLYKGEITLKKAKVKGEGEESAKAKGEGEESAKAKGEGEESAKAKGEGEESAKAKGEGEQRSSSSLKLRNSETSKLRNSETLCTIPVALRVLDFTLPSKPKCYFDVEKDYVTCFCEYVSVDHIMTINGGDRALAERELKAILANYVRHGYVTPCFREAGTTKWRKIAQEIGLDYTHAGAGASKLASKAEMRLHADLLAQRLDREIGYHKGLSVGWGDEYGLGTLRNIRPMIETYHDRGFIFNINSRYGYDAGVYIADVYWPPVNPDGSSAPQTAKYNEATAGQGTFGWYADHHVGVENPAFCRRQYGFGPYRAGLSCNFNYAHHLDGWNDIAYTLYKPMILVYGTGSGCVDTLAWEGFREGQDDIRYATLLKQLALPMAQSDKTAQRYAARLALKLLADADRDDMDLGTLRLEMIEHIENLRGLKN